MNTVCLPSLPSKGSSSRFLLLVGSFDYRNPPGFSNFDRNRWHSYASTDGGRQCFRLSFATPRTRDNPDMLTHVQGANVNCTVESSNTDSRNFKEQTRSSLLFTYARTFPLINIKRRCKRHRALFLNSSFSPPTTLSNIVFRFLYTLAKCWWLLEKREKVFFEWWGGVGVGK